MSTIHRISKLGAAATPPAREANSSDWLVEPNGGDVNVTIGSNRTIGRGAILRRVGAVFEQVLADSRVADYTR